MLVVKMKILLVNDAKLEGRVESGGAPGGSDLWRNQQRESAGVHILAESYELLYVEQQTTESKHTALCMDEKEAMGLVYSLSCLVCTECGR